MNTATNRLLPLEIPSTDRLAHFSNRPFLKLVTSDRPPSECAVTGSVCAPNVPGALLNREIEYALVRMTSRGRTFFALWFIQPLCVVKYPLLTWALTQGKAPHQGLSLPCLLHPQAQVAMG